MKKRESVDNEICCEKCRHFTFVVASADLSFRYGFCLANKEPENTRMDFVSARKFDAK